jgi:peptidoglycan/xylan/chitin deacetylase (PgdA/CDA1 family)
MNLAGVAVPLERASAATSHLLSEAQTWRLFATSLAGLSLALCLHRLSRTRRDELHTSPEELDRFIERARRARSKEGLAHRPWLTVTFDDGYESACRYIESRAEQFPDVEFVIFVCPEKAERGAGFRWDLRDETRWQHCDIATENRRLDLQAIAVKPENRLASIDELRRLRRFSNAHVGNHTNCHFRASELAPEVFAAEMARSSSDFARLFGHEEHFAFPFGGPELDFDTRHVDILRKTGRRVIWSTSRRPYLSAQRHPGAVLPRIPVDGRATATETALAIAVRAMLSRARGLPPFYPLAASR